MPPPTIIDVANACKVSPSTVSLVLSDHPRIPSTTKEKVRKKIAELNYRPNPIARSLVNGRTKILAVLIPPAENVFSDPYYMQALDGIYTVTKASGYKIILEVGTDDFWESREYEKTIHDGLAEGLIFLGGLALEHEKLATPPLRRRCVVVGETPFGLAAGKISAVSGDNYGGGYAATDYLIRLGHRKIAHVRGDIKVNSVSERFRGYKSAIVSAGIAFDKKMVFDGYFREWDAYLAAKEFLSGPSRPSAVFAGNDVMAFGVIRAANEMGLNVPGDISVVGMDDVPAAAGFFVPLTTVKYPIYAMGTYAASSLIDAIEGRSPRGAAAKIFDVALIERKSAAPFKKLTPFNRRPFYD